MKLSIITINRNNGEGLKNTIESIVSFCSSAIEYIVIDGESTDNSVQYIKAYSDKINYWISEPDSGIFNAMNKGISQSSGEYLLFINSGDILNKDIDLGNIVAGLTGEDLIYYDIIVTDNIKGEYIHPSPPILDFKFFAERSLPHQATFIKKDMLIKYGKYNERMRLGADWAFFLDVVCLAKCKYRYINSSFSTYYLDGISSQPENHSILWKEKENHIKTNYPLYYSLYKEWMDKKDELYRLKSSISVRTLKKIGLLKWLKL